MSDFPTKKQLIDMHRDGEILHGKFAGDLLRAAVYGANDGIVTTFAVVAGVAGAQLSADVILILGIANMVADGLSMGLGDYLGSASELKYKNKQMMLEEWEWQQIPDIEKAEIVQYYQDKGYSEKDAQELVALLKKNPQHMIELGFRAEMGEIPDPEEKIWLTGLVTFFAFVLAGSLPLLPYVVQTVGIEIPVEKQFSSSIFATVVALFFVGSLRTYVTGGRWWVNGFQMLGIGSLAAITAYVFGVVIERFVVGL